VRQSPRKDIRVWMQSGEGDLALPPGNWPMYAPATATASVRSCN